MTTLKQYLIGFCEGRRGPAPLVFMILSLSLMLSQSALSANTWTSTGSMTTARSAHTATLLTNGRVLVVGGHNGSYLDSAELYDPAMGTWTSASSLTTARENHTATLLPNGQVLVAGGYNGNYLASAELYDPAKNTWTTTASLITARSFHTATHLDYPYDLGQVVVAGGYNGNYLVSAETFDAALETWGLAGAPATARAQHTTTFLPGGLGRILVVGGHVANDEAPVPAVELYSIDFNWTSASYLALAPFSHTATLLPNGQVLVAGGFNYTDLIYAWLYNGKWTMTGSLATARHAHTATLLRNGKVLVAGGDNAASGSLASAELYPVGLSPSISELLLLQ